MFGFGIRRKIAALIRKVAESAEPTDRYRIPEEWRRPSLQEKVKRRYTEGETAKPQPKIFGIGLSKTGTTSLARALAFLGYESGSWKSGTKVLGWPEFFHMDAVTDTPCAAQFESLYHVFRQSKFIYTTRDPESWSRSMIEHFGEESPEKLRKRQAKRAFWEGKLGWEWYNTLRRVQIRERLYAQHSTWEEAYNSFDDRVCKFFKNKPDDRFLVMNIPNGDGWKKLCSFLGHEVPDKSFPHKNKTIDMESKHRNG
jgi:hypothetical protein